MSQAHEIGKDERTADVSIETDVKFTSFALKDSIKNGLIRCGYIYPSPIQRLAIPEALIGVDLVMQAKSGTGKTVVFAVAALQTITETQNVQPQVLVVAPTREIASQISECIKMIGRVMTNVHVNTFVGGIDLQCDKKSLKKCNIVVGTPGRIKQLLTMKMLRPHSIRLLVLDEADKLIDGHFVADVNFIFNQLPLKKQMIASSATFPPKLSAFIAKYMRTPKEVRLGSSDPSLLGVTQYVHFVPDNVTKVDFTLNLMNTVTFSQAMIFCNDKELTQDTFKVLKEQKFPVECISGQMMTKERNQKMDSLRSKNVRILITTDLCSRGIDVQNVNLVINLDFPFSNRAIDTYLHRIGRSGRFGSKGSAVTVLVSESAESRRFLNLIEEHGLKVNKYEGQLENLDWNHDQEWEMYQEWESMERSERQVPKRENKLKELVKSGLETQTELSVIDNLTKHELFLRTLTNYATKKNGFRILKQSRKRKIEGRLSDSSDLKEPKIHAPEVPAESENMLVTPNGESIKVDPVNAIFPIMPVDVRSWEKSSLPFFASLLNVPPRV